LLVYTIIPFANWTRYFLAYYPGKMTYDSFWQWSMAHGIKQYNAWHPILHTLWIQAASAIYDSPSAYIFSQMVVVACIIGYSLYVLQSFGAPKWLLVTFSLAYAFYPINGFYVITMWKDVPFAAFLLLIAVYFSKITQTNGQWLDKKLHCLMFIIVCFVTMNLRNNGFIALLLALIFLIVLMDKIRKKLFVISGIIVAAHLLFNYPIMTYMHVIKNPLNQALAIPSQQIAATYRNNGRFTPEIKKYFNSILPADQWKKDYNPYTVDPIKHDPLYNSTMITKNFGIYLVNWEKLLRLNLGIYVKAYLNQVSVIWQFYSPPGYHVYVGSPSNLDDYPLNVRMADLSFLNSIKGQSESSTINNAYVAYVKEARAAYPNVRILSFKQYKVAALKAMDPLKTDSKQMDWKNHFDLQFKGLQSGIGQSLFAKGAIYLFLLVISLSASIQRYKWKGLIVYTPALFVLLTIAIAIPATDFRYSYSFIVSVPFLLLYGKFMSPLNMELNNDEE